MENDTNKFLNWLSKKHELVYGCLVAVTAILVGFPIIMIVFYYPYLLILAPIVAIPYTIHLYRKGDWK